MALPIVPHPYYGERDHDRLGRRAIDQYHGRDCFGRAFRLARDPHFRPASVKE